MKYDAKLKQTYRGIARAMVRIESVTDIGSTRLHRDLLKKAYKITIGDLTVHLPKAVYLE